MQNKLFLNCDKVSIRSLRILRYFRTLSLIAGDVTNEASGDTRLEDLNPPIVT